MLLFPLCRQGSQQIAIPPKAVFLARSLEIKSSEIALPYKNLYPQGRLNSHGKEGF